MKISHCAKRVLDIFISFTFLVVFLPPITLIAIAIKIESKGSVFFKQKRIGKQGRVFTLYKFRSMYVVNNTEDRVHNRKDVTRIGKIIRKWRIDELPQFFNVLKGDMSIVGPRPTIPRQVERYSVEQKRRLDIKPGLTGWSQLHGDSAISWPDRIRLDLWYLDHWSLTLDFKIMALTPFALFKIRNINTENGPPPDEISSLDF